MMKLNRKIIQIIILSCMIFNIISIYGVNSVQGVDESDLSEISQDIRVTTGIITVSPSYLEVSGIKNTLASGGIYTTPSGGQIKITRSPSLYLNTDKVSMGFVSTEVDENGNLTALFMGSVPVEFDYDIYTLFSAINMNPNNKALTTSSLDQSQLAVARLYAGDGVDDDDWFNMYDTSAQDNGWAYSRYDVPQAEVIEHTGLPWYYRGNYDYRVGRKEPSPWSGYYGDDGRDDFQSTQATKVWYSNVPYMMIGDPSVDGTTIETVNPAGQVDKILAHATSSKVDIGNFNIGWNLNIQPIQGTKASISLNKDGTAKLVTPSTWYGLSEAYTLSGDGDSNEDKKGFFTENPNIIKGVVPKDETNLIKTTDTSKPVSDSKANGGKAFIFSCSNPIIASPITIGGSSAFWNDYPVSDLALISKDLNKNKDDFTSEESSSIFNYTQWDLQFNGYRLTPRVSTYVKDVSVNYKESWVDYDLNSLHENQNNDQLIKLPSLLAGLKVENAFQHQRVRVIIDIYSRYNIYLEQSDDAKDLSRLKDKSLQGDPYGDGFVDLDEYGSEEYSTTVTANEDWFSKWLASLGQYQWIIWAVIGVVALILVAYIYSLVPKRPPQPSQYYNYPQPTPQFIIAQPQGYYPQTQVDSSIQQQNRALTTMVQELQNELQLQRQLTNQLQYPQNTQNTQGFQNQGFQNY